jgi:hypothetical protein
MEQKTKHQEKLMAEQQRVERKGAQKDLSLQVE